MAINGSTDRSKSKQDYRTPFNLIQSLSKYFGVNFVFDLAATSETRIEHVADRSYFGPDQIYEDDRDGLTAGWPILNRPNEALWLNPPFNVIPSWLRKLRREQERTRLDRLHMMSADNSGDKSWIPTHHRATVMLLPVCLGTSYFSELVYTKGGANVLILKGRVKFRECKQTFDRDLMAIYFPDVTYAHANEKLTMNISHVTSYCPPTTMGIYDWRKFGQAEPTTLKTTLPPPVY